MGKKRAVDILDAFLQLPADQRRAAFIECEVRLGLNSNSVEKDLWVCWTLRELFGLPEIGQHLFFKGGTSLSKAWRLIDRFSADIDIVLDRGYLSAPVRQLERREVAPQTNRSVLKGLSSFHSATAACSR